MKKYDFVRRTAITAGLVAGLWLSPLTAGERIRLTVLHTSDIHGQVLPFDDARDRPAPGSLARVSAAVDAIRGSTDHSVLLIDSGDSLQGTLLEEFTNVRRKEPSPTIEAMNHLGYAAMAVGNHEFNFGLEVLRRAEAEADFPFLAANAVDTATENPAFQPFLIQKIDGLTVGILGLVTSNIPGWETPEHYRGMHFEPMDESARHWVRYLREEKSCDVVIVLAHTGFEVDPETGESNGTEYENFGNRLVAVPGIDLLLTGHAHQDISPTDMNGVIVSQPSSRGRRLTRIDLEFEGSGEAWKMVHWEGRNLDLSWTKIDEDLVAAFDEKRKTILVEMDTPLTVVDRAVSVRGCRVRDCAANDLIHQVQLAVSGADLSLASLLTNSTPDLAPGPVTQRWVRSLYTYPNTLRVLKLTGAQVKDVLEHAARYYVGLECSGSAGCEILTNPDVRHYNVDTIQGLTYRIDPNGRAGAKVFGLSRHGMPLDLHADFTLVCNNYRAVGGGSFPHLAEADIVWQSSKEVAELVIEYLEKMEVWQPSADENWNISPRILGEKRAGRNAGP